MCMHPEAFTLQEDPQLYRNFLGHSIRQLQDPHGVALRVVGVAV